MECPSQTLVVALGGGLSYVVEQSGPAEPLVVALRGHVVEHLKGMVEIVLMPLAVLDRHSFKLGKRWENYFEQPGAVEQLEAIRGARGADYLRELIVDAFFGDDSHPAAVPRDRLECFRMNLESELGCEAYRAHHPEGVVGESDVRIEGSAYCARLDVGDSAEGVHEFSESSLV